MTIKDVNFETKLINEQWALSAVIIQIELYSREKYVEQYITEESPEWRRIKACGNHLRREIRSIPATFVLSSVEQRPYLGGLLVQFYRFSEKCPD